jgi:hypothetical protein
MTLNLELSQLEASEVVVSMKRRYNDLTRLIDNYDVQSARAARDALSGAYWKIFGSPIEASVVA